MPKDQRKRQEKLLKRRLKQKQKKKQAARASFGVSEKAVIRRACSYPLYECHINDGWQEQGMASILISRRQSESLVILGSYIVDIYCLGVKDTYCRANLPMAKYHETRERYINNIHVKKCSPELAHQVIYGGIDFAAGLDLQPHKDFLLSRHVLEPREAIPPNPDIEFGKNGKPFYVAGPHDNFSRIMNHLENTLGRDGFHFIVPLEDPDEYDDFDMNSYEDEDLFEEDDED
jgi:hypothetical protein